VAGSGIPNIIPSRERQFDSAKAWIGPKRAGSGTGSPTIFQDYAMKQSHTSRNYAKAFFAFVTIGLVNACADANVAPRAADEAVAFTAPAGFDKVVDRINFRLNNREGAVQKLGDHLITIPANAICDPRTSTYGPTEWKKPCNLMRGTINITATVMRDEAGRPYVDFQPALRFAPDKQVMLFLRNGRSPEPTKIFVEYCNNAGVCVDESLSDPTFKPFRVGSTSMIGRRLGHFSGYTVGWGERCIGTLTQEPDGTWMCNDDGLMRRSGYMVASGLVSEKGEGVKEEEKDDKKQDDSQY
jgi:hypothetical protein